MDGVRKRSSRKVSAYGTSLSETGHPTSDFRLVRDLKGKLEVRNWKHVKHDLPSSLEIPGSRLSNRQTGIENHS
jgi:hypothetical protein